MGGRGVGSGLRARAGGFKEFGGVVSPDPDADQVYESDETEVEVVDFFQQNSNYDALISGMDAETSADFESWTGGELMGRWQYAPFSERAAYLQDTTRRMDAVLDRATLAKGIVVKRIGSAEFLGLPTFRAGSMGQLNALIGRTIVSTGYMSTAAAPQGLNIEGRANVEYSLRIPGGSKGAAMFIGDRRINFYGAKQREVIVNRDTAWRVGGVRYDDARQTYVVELDYVGRNPHDYG